MKAVVVLPLLLSLELRRMLASMCHLLASQVGIEASEDTASFYASPPAKHTFTFQYIQLYSKLIDVAQVSRSFIS